MELKTLTNAWLTQCPSGFATQAKVCEIMSKSDTYVRKWLNENEIKAFGSGKGRLYSVEDIATKMYEAALNDVGKIRD